MLILSLVVAAAAVVSAPAPKAPTALVSFSSAEGMARLDRSKAKVDFFFLAPQFESQTNKAFCGPTSAAIVLNAVRAGTKDDAPEDLLLLPPEAKPLLPPGMDALFHRWTQNDLFDAKTDAVKTKAEVFGKPRSLTSRPDPGIQLRQLGGILAAHGLDVTTRVADEKLADDAMRKELAENLAREGDFVIVNFLRSALGQEGGGHISPLGAWDEASDSFLLMDVNPNGHTWVWVPSADLFKAMRTKDTAENRGYLLVKDAAAK